MNGTQVGNELKRLRSMAHVSSRELSKRVGKAPAYVSQLERGLIKIPDFSTCYSLFKLLGVDEDRIENMLQHFGIAPPRQLAQQIEWAERQADEEDFKHKTNFYRRKFVRLEQSVRSIDKVLYDLIEDDLDKADTVITNLLVLTEEEKDFEFLCDMFEHDLSKLKRKNQLKILRFVTECVNEDHTERFVEMGNKE